MIKKFFTRRQNSTHFIEQYNGIRSGVVHHTEIILPIEFLDEELEDTKNCETLETVAIFKIKYKNND